VTPVVEIDRFLWSLDMVPDGLQRFYLDPLLDLLECSVPREHRRAFPLGHAGIAEAVRTGRDDLARGLLDRVLIVGVDSYLDDLTVSWLARDDRLKTGEHATGVLPGEAGACVMLERGAAAAARRARADARVLAAALRPASRVPSRPSEADIPALGRRLAAAAIEALDAVPGARPFRGDLILDLNGENWRASAWGYAQIHLRDAVDFDGCREILPTVSFGEIGAATGPAALCVAARSWARGYALGDRALICNVSDTGAVGAVVLGAPATPFRGSGPNGAASLLQRAGAAESPASISRSTSP
jgi:3-oxoacyl-[acyl-carrier-protein] synthase-1